MPARDRPAPDYPTLVANRVPSMLAYWDRDERCRFANQAYHTWFGADPAAMIGHTMRELLGPDLYALNQPHIRAALAGEEQLFERIVPGPDGVRRHSLAHYLPHVVDGRVEGFVVQVTEVTRLKETEAALRQEQALRVALEAHTAELDALLHERSEMLEMLAHEVRQPLHNAAVVLENAATELGQAGAAGPLPTLVRAQSVLSQVMGSLDNTLTAAALVERPDHIRHVDTDIDLLIGIAIGDLPPHKRVRVQVERETRTRTAAMDISLMRLALRNLLVNALRYSPEDRPVVVRVSDSDEPLALVIDVVDQGPGIEASLVSRLFERGTRGEYAAAVSAGHGLGLYIVRRVMELHHGSVELVRNTPHGVTMRLVISQQIGR
jgi:two-component system, OmpR family, sensor kinase